MKSAESNRSTQVAPNVLSLDQTGPPALDRRQFIVAVGGITAFAAASVSASATTQSIKQTVYSPISIGYWAGGEDWRLGAEPRPFASRVVAAESMSHDINAFRETGAEITLHGLFGGPISPDTDSLEVRAQYMVETDHGRTPVPFHAWSYHTGRQTPFGDEPRTSQPVRFTMPVNGKDGLRLSVIHRLRRNQAKETSVSLAHHEEHLVLNHEQTMLRPGVYVFAIGNTQVPASPNWNALLYQPQAACAGSHCLLRRTLKGVREVDFPYLLASIIPAGSDRRYSL